MQFTYSKQEKLKKRKLLKTLFKEGKATTVFPLRMVYLKHEHSGNFPVQASVSVSKRNFKRAVDRNRIKRLLREAYRLNKYILYDNLEDNYIMMFIYLAKEEEPFQVIEKNMQELMQKFLKKIDRNDKK
ncbi:MAG TPA: ribonuclease P protein component [Flavobacteriia bacterium]|nr:ribonuclease P protein component [Flavobacteriia bacterium]